MDHKPGSSKDEDFFSVDLDTSLDEITELTLYQPVQNSRRRRQTVHGNEIKKENKFFLNTSTSKNDGKRHKVNRSSSSSSLKAGRASASAPVAVPVVQKQSSTLPRIMKHTLRRRMSTCLVKHKLKKFQDYSLPYQHDSFALLRETCNIRSNLVSPPRSFVQNQEPKAKAPPKPPRQKTPRRKSIGVPRHSPVWKKYKASACILKDRDLQQKIEHEIKMREGTARLLSASKHPAQVQEAAKSLLTSNTRIIAYMTELQRRKTAEVLGNQQFVEGNQLPCRSQVSVSDIRIPLMWRDSDHFKNKGDYRRYAVFCMLKVGTEIYDTSMIRDVDRTMTDITFDDVILFDEVPHDFDMKLEVYCHKLHEEFSVSNTPKKLRKKINDISGSVGRSVGKRLSGLNDSDVIGNMVLGPKFELVAKGSLHLSDVDNSVRTFDLEMEANSEGQVHELPLFGHYCCRVAALPHCLTQPTVSGFLNLQEGDDLSQWRQYWCCLKNLQLACWASQDDAEVCQPLLTIPVTKSTQISDADPTACEKPHAFVIKTVNTEGIFDHTLAADSKEDLNKWWDGFQQHLLDQALWKHACDGMMDLRIPPSRRQTFVRKSSIYDETPYIEPDTSSEGSSVSDVGSDQLSQMLHALMGENQQLRGGAASSHS